MNGGEDRTMDRKQRKKIVTKNKAAVFIAALALLVAIILVFLFHSLERQGKEQQALSMEEREQLTDMTEYLDEIDGIVTMNQERLAEATLFQSDTENVLNTFQESLSVLEKDLERVETIIQSHTEKETSTNREISASFEALSESQNEIKEQIATVNASIAAIISEIRTENENNFTTAFEKLEKLEDDIAKTQKEAESYYDSLTELITQLQEDNSSQYEELTNTLLTAQADLAELLKNGFEALQLQLDEDFTALMEKLECLHGQIIDTTDSITGLLGLMEENNMDRQEEIKTAFASVSESLELIRTEYTDAHMELQSLIQKVQETQNANHEETLSVLTVMETNMEETSLENLNQLTNSLQTMEENFSASISNMKGEMEQSFSTLNTGIENSFSQTNDSITNQFRELNTRISSQYESVSNQYQNISSTIINNNDSQQESLDNLMGYLNQKLQEVFQFVSNGKKKLASALLTKGVPIREDATFAEIYQAILNIPQKLVIGVQQIPGTISYDYHYHTDAQGRNPHTEVAGSAGGCYTAPIYHVHTGSSNGGGGCYSSPVYHTHSEGCYSEGSHNSSCPSHTGYHSYDCGSVHDWDGDGHGCDGFVAYDCGGHSYLSCNLGSGIIGYSLNCGKNNSTIEGYRPACGLSDGQIIGAHIVYDQNALGAAAVMYTEAAYDTLAYILEENAGQVKDVQEVSGNVAEAEEEETGLEQEESGDAVEEEADEGIETEEENPTEEAETEQELEEAEDSETTGEGTESEDEAEAAENLETVKEQEE